MEHFGERNASHSKFEYKKQDQFKSENYRILTLSTVLSTKLGMMTCTWETEEAASRGYNSENIVWKQNQPLEYVFVRSKPF